MATSSGTTSRRTNDHAAIGEVASQFAADGKELASVAVGEASRLATEQATRLNDEYIQPAWTATQRYVRDHPVKSILMSAAAGALIGAYCFRRRS